MLKTKLNNVVGKKVFKKNVYDKFVKKINAIHTIDNTNLVGKADYNTKKKKLKKRNPDHDKYITTPELNKSTAGNFAARLKQANLASKNHIANFVKKTSFDEIFTSKEVISNKRNQEPS